LDASDPNQGDPNQGGLLPSDLDANELVTSEASSDADAGMNRVESLDPVPATPLAASPLAATPPAASAPAGPRSDAGESLASSVRALDELARRVEELARLRRHDADLVDRLHAENSRLRQGELTEAMAPLLRQLMRLHDQMTSLGGDDGQSVAGILRGQLLQALDLAADVRPYTAVPGMPFDPARHVGLRRVGTDDRSRDRTIARTVKPGFVRGESTVVRPAEVEVYRAH
jgi:molecular chaperone GrpE (heat shock protein)